MLTRSEFRAEDLLVLGTTVQNLVATGTRCQQLVHPCRRLYL